MWWATGSNGSLALHVQMFFFGKVSAATSSFAFKTHAWPARCMPPTRTVTAMP